MMCWRSNRKSGCPSQKIIFLLPVWPLAPPGPSFLALFWSILSYFVPNGLPIARDSWATGREGQVRSRGTTSGSSDVTWSRIPRLRSRRVLCCIFLPIFRTINIKVTNFSSQLQHATISTTTTVVGLSEAKVDLIAWQYIYI